MAEVVFRNSMTRFLVLLSLPGALAVGWLLHLSRWAFWIFPASDPLARQIYGFGPLLLAAAILGLLLLAAADQRTATLRLTPNTLYRRVRGGREEAWPLEHLYVMSSGSRLYPMARVTDGRRSFRVHAFFLPEFPRFCRLLREVARARRQVDCL